MGWFFFVSIETILHMLHSARERKRERESDSKGSNNDELLAE